MSKLIDLDILDKAETVGICNLIRSGIKRGVMAGNYGSELTVNVEELVLKIDRLMQDLIDDKSENEIFLYEKLNESLKLILPIAISDEIDDFILLIIENYLKDIHEVYQVAIKFHNVGQIDNLFKNFSIEQLKQELRNNERHITTYKYANTIIDLTNSSIPKTKKVRAKDADSFGAGSLVLPQNHEFKRIKSDLGGKKNNTTWDIDLTIINKDDSKSIYSLWLILVTLKSINGVEIEITEIKKGSLTTKIKAWIKSDEARKEVEELLSSAKKLAMAKLEKDFYENEISKSQIEKINAEKEKLEKENELANSEEEKRRIELEIEALEIDNEYKRLRNEELKFNLTMKKLQYLAELLSTDLINNEEYKLYINNELQIHKKKDNTIEIGELSENK